VLKLANKQKNHLMDNKVQKYDQKDTYFQKRSTKKYDEINNN